MPLTNRKLLIITLLIILFVNVSFVIAFWDEADNYYRKLALSINFLSGYFIFFTFLVIGIITLNEKEKKEKNASNK